MLSEELLREAPMLWPYIDAIEKSLGHILNNYYLIQDNNSSQDLFREAAMIFLSSANITSMWGDLSGINQGSLADMIKDAIKLMINMEIFGDVPMVYQTLEQLLASNSTNLIVQQVTELSAWLVSNQTSGLDMLTQALPKVYEIIRSLLSVLTQTGVDMPSNMELFEDLAGNVIAMLRQLLSTSGLLPPMQHHPSMFRQNIMSGNHSIKARHRREAAMMPTRDPMDDFIDLFSIDYPAMFKAISVPPATDEIMETVHLFFANPNLNTVVKGATRGILWEFDASQEETIDATVGVLSFLTLPDIFQR